MAIDKVLKAKVDAELALGKTPTELSHKYGIPYVTINGWKKKLEDTNKNVEELKKIDPVIVNAVIETIKETAPAEVSDKLDALGEAVTSLDTLEKKFHTIVMNLLNAAETMSKKEDLSIRDWKALGDGIGSLYSSIFNKAGVVVNNLNQTTVSGEKMTLFKNSLKN